MNFINTIEEAYKYLDSFPQWEPIEKKPKYTQEFKIVYLPRVKEMAIVEFANDIQRSKLYCKFQRKFFDNKIFYSLEGNSKWYLVSKKEEEFDLDPNCQLLAYEFGSNEGES